jgi:3-deoxy-manno-octulosonate cytidylyltransferase (CMP-KDO synthetase)
MYRIVIPARYGSTRLPGKPLLEIAGKPMLQWVHERAAGCLAHEVLIATDDERIMQLAAGFGAAAILTSSDHASGTDRIAEVAALRGWGDDEIVVNLQGDEPGMPGELVEQVAALLLESPRADIATLATPVRDRDEYFDPNAVKVVTDHEGRALYFSRAPIPWYCDPAGVEGPVIGARRHLGLYAYRVSALRRLAALEPAPIERAERLEQLRALANGLCIVVGEALRRPGPDVNTADDLVRAAVALAASGPSLCE